MPSPKFHDTAAPPTEVFVKLIKVPAQALFGVKVNAALGASLKQIVSLIVFTHDPSALVTVIVPLPPPPHVIKAGLVAGKLG